MALCFENLLVILSLLHLANINTWLVKKNLASDIANCHWKANRGFGAMSDIKEYSLFYFLYAYYSCLLLFIQIAKHKIYVQINIAKSNILTDAHMN